MAGPFVVVEASVASAWIALASDDGLVADDYYKQGLLINRRLAAAVPARAQHPAATISFGADGEVRVHIDQGTAPARLRLSVKRPGEHDFREVGLSMSAEGDWVGRDVTPSPGRLIVKLESDRWELPVTTTAARPSRIRLGAAADRS